MSIYTVGHSTYEPDAFLRLLDNYDIRLVVDVRSHPTSHFPHFRMLTLKGLLNRDKRGYIWREELGGWGPSNWEKYEEEMKEHRVETDMYKGEFPKHRIAAYRDEFRTHMLPTWYSQGLWDYSWYMTTLEFMEGMDRLLRQYDEAGGNWGLMCAEALWWKCHRSMIADYLVWIGRDATHIQPKVEEHSKVIGDRLKRYDPMVIKAWERHKKMKGGGI